MITWAQQPLMKSIAEALNIEVAEGLKKAIQAPLVTLWWSIACLSAWFTDHHLIASRA